MLTKEMRNNSFSEIKNAMEKADSILFITHMIIDGDSAGSAAALCRVMLSLGKTAHIFPGEPLPRNLRLLDFEGFIKNEEELLPKYDLVVAVDCSDEGRFEKRASIFERGEFNINIDHHFTNNYYCDLNYIDAAASSAGEVVFHLIDEAGWHIDEKIAEAIYVAIVTDTGEFQYSSTSAETHRIAARLIEAGIDLNEISVSLFQSERKQKYLLQTLIMQTLEFCENDRFAIAFSDISMYERTDSEFQESDGIVELLRNIDGVEISAFAKEIAPGVMKVGFRSKHELDVAELAEKFGGGGHKKAAGCTIHGSIEDVKKALYPEVAKIFDKERDNN